jgi:hypothetical protein
VDTNQLLVEVDRSDPVFAVVENAFGLRQNKGGTLSDSLTSNEVFRIDIEEMNLVGFQQRASGQMDLGFQTLAERRFPEQSFWEHGTS